MAHIVELSFYPIKSCAGTSVPDALLTPAGLAHDRSFMVVSEQGVFRTQRRDPRLALIRPTVDAEGTRLEMDAPDIDPITVDVDASGARRAVDLFGAPYSGIDQGDRAAAWLSDVLRTPSRLVRVPPEHHRVTDGRTPGTSGYADSCPLHVVSRATLALLDRRLAARGAPPVPADRFRANVVVDGWDEAHTEDRTHRLSIGEAELGYAKPAIRCAVTLVDQRTGTRAGPEPLRTLAGYRRTAEGGIAFGAKFAVLRPGKVSVGDSVNVSEWGGSELQGTGPLASEEERPSGRRR